jgi:lysozyme
MKTSQQGIEQLKSFEGFRSMPYNDGVGKMTVGYGHMIVHGDGCVVGSPITMGQATSLLATDLSIAECCLNDTGIELTQNEFDALVSFIYNLGVGTFQRSTLLKLLKAGNKDAAAREFPKWDHAPASSVNQGILKRRLAEKRCFQGDGYVG